MSSVNIQLQTITVIASGKFVPNFSKISMTIFLTSKYYKNSTFLSIIRLSLNCRAKKLSWNLWRSFQLEWPQNFWAINRERHRKYRLALGRRNLPALLSPPTEISEALSATEISEALSAAEIFEAHLVAEVSERHGFAEKGFRNFSGIVKIFISLL